MGSGKHQNGGAVGEVECDEPGPIGCCVEHDGTAIIQSGGGVQKEELVAEMSAAFSMAQLGRSSVPRADHANYLASWVQVLKSNPKALFQAASLAEKASAFVLDAHDRTLVSA